MVSSGISYELLFDLLRRERNRDDLQKLDATFYVDVLSYMAQKQSSFSSDMSAESEKARIQFHNIKKILKELYDRREKKIVMLALNAVRTGAMFADASSFLPEEHLLFNELKTHFSKYRAEILENVLRGSAPFSGSVPFAVEVKDVVSPSLSPSSLSSPSGDVSKASLINAESEHKVREDSKGEFEEDSKKDSKKDSKEEFKEDSKQKSTSESSLKEGLVDAQPSSSSNDSIHVSFLKAVPRFAGSDDEVFGPFSPGDKASLPSKIASVLVRKGRAEEI